MILYAKDIAEKDFISLDGDADAFMAARTMRDRKHGFVIVTSKEGKPVGIVTEWDYISKLAAENRDPTKVLLKDIMSTNPVSVDSDLGIDEVSQLMSKKGIRRVLVVSHGEVIGVITSRTVMACMREYLDTISTQIAGLQGPFH